MDLNGARILVVGATGVLGRRLCERLSERTTDIVVTGRSASAAEELRRVVVGVDPSLANALLEYSNASIVIPEGELILFE